MKKQLLLYAVFISLFSATCNRQPILDNKANYIAGLECRAISLREQRFALANELRFAQDTLLHLKADEDSTKWVDRIHSFTKEKETLLQQSLQLADTLHLALDSLRKFVFKNNGDKQLFNQKLKEALRKRGCSEA